MTHEPVGKFSDYNTATAYECGNCQHKDDEDNLPDAKNLLMRLTPGDTFTNKECPRCGALCLPVVEAGT